MLSRTAAQLQKQLAALQAQTLAFTSAIASNNFKQRSPNPSAAAMPLMSGYHHLAAASAAERHAASIAAVAASISARTFQPAAAKVGVQDVQLVRYCHMAAFSGPGLVPLCAALHRKLAPPTSPSHVKLLSWHALHQ